MAVSFCAVGRGGIGAEGAVRANDAFAVFVVGGSASRKKRVPFGTNFSNFFGYGVFKRSTPFSSPLRTGRKSVQFRLSHLLTAGAAQQSRFSQQPCVRR